MKNGEIVSKVEERFKLPLKKIKIKANKKIKENKSSQKDIKTV